MPIACRSRRWRLAKTPRCSPSRWRSYRPAIVGVATDAAREELERRLGSGRRPLLVAVGPAGLLAAATHQHVDLVLCASSGTAGLEAALAAIDAGKTLALANKEVLVMAGALMVEAARRRGVTILPVDSEHNAIHQCLHGRSLDRGPAPDSHGLGRPVSARWTPPRWRA